MEKELRFLATERSGEVSAVLRRDQDAHCLLVFAHGAGAGMRHKFMEQMADRLADQGVATLRYQFPYMEEGGRRPNPPAVLAATVRSAVDCAREAVSDLPLFAGGKSMGGRMTSTAASKEPLAGVRGLVFFGFPLHAAGRPGTERGDHLDGVDAPMLFLQGTRDRLAELDLLRPICERLGDRATLFVVQGGDHSFKVPKRSGRSQDEVLDEIADTVSSWTWQRVD